MIEQLRLVYAHLYTTIVGDHASQGARAAFVSAIATAGVAEIWLSEIPKGWLIGAVLAMFGWISFFVKRDYNRITQHQDQTDATLARIEARLASSVTHESMGSSLGRVHEKINDGNERIAALESHLGLYKPRRLTDEDTTPPAGTKVR